jgi:hypothetical protein
MEIHFALLVISHQTKISPKIRIKLNFTTYTRMYENALGQG